MSNVLAGKVSAHWLINKYIFNFVCTVNEYFATITAIVSPLFDKMKLNMYVSYHEFSLQFVVFFFIVFIAEIRRACARGFRFCRGRAVIFYVKALLFTRYNVTTPCKNSPTDYMSKRWIDPAQASLVQPCLDRARLIGTPCQDQTSTIPCTLSGGEQPVGYPPIQSSTGSCGIDLYRVPLVVHVARVTPKSLTLTVSGGEHPERGSLMTPSTGWNTLVGGTPYKDHQNPWP